MSITIGWWAIPAIITLAALLVAYRAAPEQGAAYGAGQVIGAAYIGLAVIVSLVAWLIWALAA